MRSTATVSAVNGHKSLVAIRSRLENLYAVFKLLPGGSMPDIGDVIAADLNELGSQVGYNLTQSHDMDFEVIAVGVSELDVKRLLK
jgi:hypothetical protein